VARYGKTGLLAGASAHRWFFWLEAVGLAWFLYLGAIAVVFLTPLAPHFQAPAHPLRLWVLMGPFFALCVWPILGQLARNKMAKEISAGYTTLGWVLLAPLRDAKTGATLRDASAYHDTFSLRAARIAGIAPVVGLAAALVGLGLVAVRVVLALA